MEMLEKDKLVRSQQWGGYFARLRDEANKLSRYQTREDFATLPTPVLDRIPIQSDSLGASDSIAATDLVTTGKVRCRNGGDGGSHGLEGSRADGFDLADSLNDASSPGPLLPLPSRDGTASDPLLADAERRLWKAIDDALAEYSREVLLIEAARCLGNSTNS